MPFSVFISHRAEDSFLARLLKSRLKYLSSLDILDPIECMVCEDIPGDAEWRKWMIDNTAKADCLILPAEAQVFALDRTSRHGRHFPELHPHRPAARPADCGPS
jgi:hypothetical protein